LEWIIVDGHSSDGTKSHLESLRDSWIHWISEPDNGIYDAMNKGIRMAKGEWLWFLNAGDVFHEQTAVDQVLKAREDADICFGEILIEEANGKALGLRSEVTPHKLPDKLEKYQFRHGMVVSHQAFVVRSRIAPLYNSDQYRFSADLDWMLNILTDRRESQCLGILARMPRSGATKDNWRQSQWERFLILCHHFGILPTVLGHVMITLRRVAFLFKTRRLR
jgi:glycosyltransferase involved in cell wall biosynthesis